VWLPCLVCAFNMLLVTHLTNNFSYTESGVFMRKLESLTADSAHNYWTCCEGAVVGLKLLEDGVIKH
jgi:hypothetical protein